MKRSHVMMLSIVSALAAGAIGLGVAGTAPNDTPPARVAVCDVATVFNKYSRAQDLSAQFSDKAKKMTDEDEQRAAAIKKVEQTLESLRQGSKEYEVRLADLEKMSMERQVWRNTQEQMAVREHRRLTEEMYKEVLEAIAASAKDKGYDLVLYREDVDIVSTTTTELLNKIAARKVLFSVASIDITAPVLERVNRQYRGK